MPAIYLVFGWRGARYGLDVQAVREIVWLPELSPVEELPAHLVGAFDLRGRVLPVMDLALRFGRVREPYAIEDRVIVIECDDAWFGIIANALHDVLPIDDSLIDEAGRYQGVGGRARFVRGEARLADGLVMLLDVRALASAPAAQGPSVPLVAPVEEDAEVFRRRAHALAQSPAAETRAGLESYAVLQLGGELFGIGLDAVREFAHLRGVVPVPCCPPHVVGNMNLRGDILTVVDVRAALGVALEGEMREVAVVRAGEVQAGVPAAQIVDVVHIAPSGIAALPARAAGTKQEFCRGAAEVGGRTVVLLDAAKILAAAELRVEQTVQ